MKTIVLFQNKSPRFRTLPNTPVSAPFAYSLTRTQLSQMKQNRAVCKRTITHPQFTIPKRSRTIRKRSALRLTGNWSGFDKRANWHRIAILLVVPVRGFSFWLFVCRKALYTFHTDTSVPYSPDMDVLACCVSL